MLSDDRLNYENIFHAMQTSDFKTIICYNTIYAIATQIALAYKNMSLKSQPRLNFSIFREGIKIIFSDINHFFYFYFGKYSHIRMFKSQ